ncbi:MAG: hypothetical protein U0641_08610 [Anaerolineae bacterium]
MSLGLALLIIHSLVRWIVVILGIVALVLFAVAWARKRGDAQRQNRWMRWFTISLDTQVLLGIILILWDAIALGQGFPLSRIEHAITMLVALGVAHASGRWRGAEPIEQARAYTFILIGVLALIFIGVSVLGVGRWTFRM